MPLSRMVQACMPPLAVQRPAECDAASPVGSIAAAAPRRRQEEAKGNTQCWGDTLAASSAAASERFLHSGLQRRTLPTARRKEPRGRNEEAKANIPCWDGVCLLRFQPLRPNHPCIPGTGAL